jgi:hypothetical protein
MILDTRPFILIIETKILDRSSIVRSTLTACRSFPPYISAYIHLHIYIYIYMNVYAMDEVRVIIENNPYKRLD